MWKREASVAHSIEREAVVLFVLWHSTLACIACVARRQGSYSLLQFLMLGKVKECPHEVLFWEHLMCILCREQRVSHII